MRRVAIMLVGGLALAAALWALAAQLARHAVLSGPAGWTVADAAVGGFPARFVMRLDRPRWNRAAGQGWSAPNLVVRAPAFAPWRLRSDLPTTQTLRMGGQARTLRADRLPASLTLSPLVRVRAARLNGAALALGTWRADALAVRLRPDGTARLLAFELDGLRGPALPPAQLRLRARLDYATAPRPRQLARPRAITLQQARLQTDAITVTAQGRLVRADAGRLAGEITLQVTGWRVLLQRAQLAGAISASRAALLAQIAARMAPEGPLTLPLRVADGTVHAGAVALFTLPAR